MPENATGPRLLLGSRIASARVAVLANTECPIRRAYANADRHQFGRRSRRLGRRSGQPLRPGYRRPRMTPRAPLAVVAVCAILCAGMASASAGVARARADRCTRIPKTVAAARVPGEVRAFGDGPVIGGGSLWAIRGNLPPRVRPHLDPVTHAYSAKFPWYLIPKRGDVPTITGRRVDGSGTFSSDANLTGMPGTAGVVTSTLVFSTPGCWEVTGAYNGSKLTFRIRVG